jgi:hypothetical protein
MGAVNFKIKVKDQYGNPLSHSYISFTSSATGDTRGGYTDYSGFATGLILKGKPLIMQVVTECGNIMGGMNVGPALQDVDLGTLTVNVTNSDLTLSGKVVDCSNNPVDSGMVDILIDGLDYRAAVTKGAFTLPISRCYNTTVPVKLTAYDFVAQQAGTQTSINASFGNMDAGTLSACGITYAQFINMTINGVNYSWTNPPDQFFYSPTDVYVTDNASRSVELKIMGGSGINATGQFQAYPILVSPGTNYGYGSSVQLNVTGFGAINGNITGTISGNMKDTLANASYPVTGSFKILRTQ